MSDSGTETITLIISEDGSTVDIEAEGFAGQTCSVATQTIAKQLGKVSDFKKKSEYFDNIKDEEVVISTR